MLVEDEQQRCNMSNIPSSGNGRPYISRGGGLAGGVRAHHLARRRPTSGWAERARGLDVSGAHVHLETRLGDRRTACSIFDRIWDVDTAFWMR